MSSVAVFWDRDNTLIDDPGYISDPGQVKLLPGAAEAVKRLTAAGFENIIITNQSGVARGYFDEAALERIHDRLVALFAEQGAKIDAIYYCPYLPGPEAKIDKYRKDSELRKPRPGMILQAALERKIELAGSWMIGDTPQDAQAGRAAGCRTILIRRPEASSARKSAEVDFLVNNLAQAAATVLKYTRHAAPPGQPSSAPPSSSAPASVAKREPDPVAPPAPPPPSVKPPPVKPTPVQPTPAAERVPHPIKGGEAIAPEAPPQPTRAPRASEGSKAASLPPTPPPAAKAPPAEAPPVQPPSIAPKVEVRAEPPVEPASPSNQGVVNVPEPSTAIQPPAPVTATAKPLFAEPTEPTARAAEPVAPPKREADVTIEPTAKKRSETQMPTDATALLQEILTFLRMVDRRSRTEEFALGKLLGAIAQIMAIGALTWALFGLIRDEPIIPRLGFAILFQLMTLTCFLLAPRK